MTKRSDLIEYACDQGEEGFALHDKMGNFTYVNPAQANMYGYEPQELIGCSWRIFYDAKEAERIDSECFPELKAKGGWSGELRGTRKDGSTFDVEVSLSILLDEEGAEAGLVCNCRDITDRKRTEAELRQLQRLDALGQLTGGVAHDFNNVLAVLTGALELASVETDSSKREEILDVAKSATRQGVSVANRLLSFSRRQSLSPESVCLVELMENLKPMLMAGLGDTVELVVDVQQGLWRCFADPRELENAIVNLALNGRDSMPHGGTLRIELRNFQAEHSSESDEENAKFIEVLVIDSGTGVDPSIVENIFDPFFTTKPVGTGSGLGLSMVYGFVQQSGGTVLVDSRLDRGTKFTLRLPKELSTGEPSMSFAEPQLRQLYRDVLLVEDDNAVRSIVGMQLKKLGCNVLEAGSVDEAKQALAATAVDLVLTDVALSGSESGIELADFVDIELRGTHVVLMSAHLDARIPHSREVLRKPFSVSQLVESLNQVGSF